MSKQSYVLWGSIAALCIVSLGGGFAVSAISVRESSCNVVAYTVYGDLVTSYAFAGGEESGMQSFSEDIATGVQESNKDDKIKAILVEIDSYGGQPVAAEEIANALKRSGKPTVALIRTVGTSAAYWAATGADVIFASKNSDVGSIGVKLSLLNQVKKNQDEGISYLTISSAPYKDLGDPNRQLTQEERVLLQKDVDIIHENFVNAVSENREISIADVRALADGRSMLGSIALEKHLIDKIGDQQDAEAYLAEIIGEEVRVCWQTE